MFATMIALVALPVDTSSLSRVSSRRSRCGPRVALALVLASLALYAFTYLVNAKWYPVVVVVVVVVVVASAMRSRTPPAE